LHNSFDPDLSCQKEPPTIRKSWIGRWLKRHPELDTDWAKPKDSKKVVIGDKDNIKAFFREFELVITDYSIIDKDIYNIDKTSYLIGIS
jgi:hypothetical protein